MGDHGDRVMLAHGCHISPQTQSLLELAGAKLEVQSGRYGFARELILRMVRTFPDNRINTTVSVIALCAAVDDLARVMLAQPLEHPYGDAPTDD